MSNSCRVIDLLIIGGGINGVGVALDAAGRGLQVALCEKDDLGGHTSSASSKLIHGGLRYLEQYEFKLVREALQEREVLLRIAPHLVHPLEFVLPLDTHMRSRFLIRLGLLLYDYLGGNKCLGHSHSIDLTHDARGIPLQKRFNRAYSYMDCRTDDARLVIANAIGAREKGATILTHTEAVHAQQKNGMWVVDLKDKKTKQNYQIKAKALVNAAGAWVSQVLQTITKTLSRSHLQLVKGSHFIVPKLYEGNHAYILQNVDQRIVFVIPYRSFYSLIGTTDILYHNDLDSIQISQDEINYLIQVVGHYFSTPLNATDILWHYSGVRALYNDEKQNPSEITREYHLELHETHGKYPIMSIFGGKLTTYRRLAERVLEGLKKFFPCMPGPWTKNSTLPGGDLQGKSFQEFKETLKKDYAHFPSALIERLADSYGERTHLLLQHARNVDDLGQHFGADLFSKEVDYLVKYEWAESVEDILWRRTKLGLILPPIKVEKLQKYLHSIIF